MICVSLTSHFGRKVDHLLHMGQTKKTESEKKKVSNFGIFSFFKLKKTKKEVNLVTSFFVRFIRRFL